MKNIAIVALLSAFVATPAVAADFYVGAQFGSTNIGAGNSMTGFGGLVGYSISPKMAVEGAYNFLGRNSSDSRTYMGASASSVYSYPINEQISVLGKLGFAGSTCSPCRGGSGGFSLGLGSQYNVNKEIGIRLGYDIYALFGGGASTLYAGGVYKF